MNSDSAKIVIIKSFLLAFVIFALFSCGKPSVFEKTSKLPDIFPEYIGVTIPEQMASDNASLFTFCMKDGSDFLTERERRGDTIWITVRSWRKGQSNGIAYQPFPIIVNHDSIDSYLAYRLIEPGYESWNRMTISQRCLESYDETVIFENDDKYTQCINCHHFHKGNPDEVLYHKRGPKGGTVIRNNGTFRCIRLNEIGPCKQGTYPAWHPDGRFVAFSSNDTHQCFMQQGSQPIEVYDMASDIILLDLMNDSIHAYPQLNTTGLWETFPCWSTDGKTLFYCVADSVNKPSTNRRNVHYGLSAIAFDSQNGEFLGNPYCVIPSADSLSVSHPRVTGDWLMFTRSSFGTFPIWHAEADLWMLHLPTGNVSPCDELNSNEAESYHSWSSNGKWVVFGSRRLDGRYTRLFISHFDGKGNFSKPFLLPQPNPEDNILRLYSYNVPEFVKGLIEP